MKLKKVLKRKYNIQKIDGLKESKITPLVSVCKGELLEQLDQLEDPQVHI